MPLAGDRDLEDARRRLADWLGKRMPRAKELRLSELSGPPSTGFSNETLIFDAAWSEDGEERRRGFVARVKATAFQVFPEYDVERQYRVMEILGERSDVPVPRVLGYEPDPEILGAPFFLMERIVGDVPSDNPPYHATGWVTEIRAEERARMWWSGIDMLARIHRLDWRTLSFDFLEMPGKAATPLERQLDYYEAFLEWASGGKPHPLERSALEWLRRHRPSASEPVVLCWGDSRLGNLMFRDFRCVAVLDWEMATLASPVMDFAWWLFFDRHHSEGCDVARLEGFPSREETIARYRELTGYSTEALDYYEIFAALRFAVIMIRVAQQMIGAGLLPADSDFDTNNTATALLAKLMGTL
jgi:aminoglycoside phosphotransferase (APT) family kinase protein